MRLARAVVEGDVRFLVGTTDGEWRLLPPEVTDTAAAVALLHEAPDATTGPVRPPSDADLRSPVVRPGKIVAIGLNYRDHIAETGSPTPDEPVVFAKFANALQDPFGPIEVDEHLTHECDYEVELAVVVGRHMRDVAPADALAGVFGYCVANDVSARDLQRATPHWDRSKSFDTFLPTGPWITTADEVPDPQALRLTTTVDGEVRQDSDTGQMLFGVAEILSFLSRGASLHPGDVVITGTPPGVAMGMPTPAYLSPGSVVTCEIDGLGRISNVVRDRSDD